LRKRFLIPEDAERLVAQAAASNVLPSDPGNRTAKHLCRKADDHGNHAADLNGN
jgi:hypothetical protein